MPDQFTERTTVGLGNRLTDSIKGILVGFLLFLVSFGVLYWNEGRAVRASKLLELANKAPIINAEIPDTQETGKLVAAQGALSTSMLLGLGDRLYVPGANQTIDIKPGAYMKLVRHVQMYAWDEDQKTETKTNLGGSETQETTYTYKKVWVDEPADSGEFRIQEGHINPPMQIKSSSFLANDAQVGILALDLTKLQLPADSTLQLTNDLVAYDPPLTTPLAKQMDYIFVGKGSLSAPKIGDVRISYSVVPANIQTTTFGVLNQNSLSPFSDKNGTLYRAFSGTKDQALDIMQNENSALTWILRVLGFILMWVGLSMLFGPISTLLDILPIAGSLSRGLIGIVTGLVAFCLSIVTILISMILHNLIALLITAIVAIALTILILKGVFKKKTIAKT